MKNIAKCKLCNSIIESKHRHDYVNCACGEISIDGGNDYHKCFAKDWKNFMRVDDQGNEIIPKVIDKIATEVDGESDLIDEAPEEDSVKKPTFNELLSMLEDMIKNIERLPAPAMTAPISNYDLASVLMLLSSLFSSLKKQHSPID